MHTFLVLVHVCSATVALLAGAMAMVLRKGSSLHRLSGSFFAVAMLLMSSSAAYVAAFIRPNPLNVVAGVLTFYLVATSWYAARRKGGTTAFDWIAIVPALGVGIGGIAVGIQATSAKPVYFIFGIIALLFAVSDVRMIVRGGVTGTKRVARHLWRMSLAFLIAVLSLYPGQARLFPQEWRETKLLFIPLIVFTGMTLFWMARMSRRRAVAG